jgi:hypothetical protein
MVSDRNFAMIVVTNSEGGAQPHNDLFADDWALRRFAGISNLAAAPQHLGSADLEPYTRRYIVQDIAVSGSLEQIVIEFRAGNGQLDGTMVTADASGHPDEKSRTRMGLAFYGPDFIRDPDGAVAWFRNHGRLYRRQ